MTGLYLLGAIILISFYSLFHNHLVLLVSNHNFVEFSFLLPGLTVAWSLFYLGQVLSVFGLLANQPGKYILPKLSSSLIAIGSTFYLSARIGPKGVVWGLVIAGLAYCLFCIFIAFKLVLDKQYMYK